jgi:disulfide bond formation protein DsbB
LAVSWRRAIYCSHDRHRHHAPFTDTRTGQAAAAVFAITTATIVAAWGFELAGYLPCPLCLQQRWAYYAVVPLSGLLLGLLIADPRRAGVVRRGLLLVALIMTAGAMLGAYHAGVEWKWWPGPATCDFGGGLSGGLPNLDTARAISCDEAQWRFLGQSFAGWNVIVSLVVVGLALWGARRPADQGHGSSSASQ